VRFALLRTHAASLWGKFTGIGLRTLRFVRHAFRFPCHANFSRIPMNDGEHVFHDFNAASIIACGQSRTDQRPA